MAAVSVLPLQGRMPQGWEHPAPDPQLPGDPRCWDGVEELGFFCLLSFLID